MVRLGILKTAWASWRIVIECHLNLPGKMQGPAVLRSKKILFSGNDFDHLIVDLPLKLGEIFLGYVNLPEVRIKQTIGSDAVPLSTICTWKSSFQLTLSSCSPRLCGQRCVKAGRAWPWWCHAMSILHLKAPLHPFARYFQGSNVGITIINHPCSWEW